MSSSYIQDEAASKFPYLLAGDQRDHKAWAKRILYREERRDPTLTSLQVKFARMALEVQDESRAKG